MKQASSVRKTARPTRPISRPDAFAVPQGIALAPPAYGINVVDSQPVQPVPKPGQDYQPLASATWPAGVGAIQRQAVSLGAGSSAAGAPQQNRTGLPDNLKAGIESLSGLTMDDVRVRYNSSKPAQLQALAYAQGTEIHVGPGQERNLPHEAWHVVQQKQGRVKPTMQMKETAINDDTKLENEADVMGNKALQIRKEATSAKLCNEKLNNFSTASAVTQRAVGFEFETGWLIRKNGQPLKKKDKVGTENHVGFKIEADEAADHQSEIEFIVHPPVPVKDNTKSQLSKIMDAIADYGNGLLDIRVFNGWNTLDNLTGQPQDSNYEFYGFDSDLKAGPQITSGLSLDQISSIPKAIEKTPLPEGAASTLSEIRNVDIALSEIELDKYILPFKPISPKLKGLLTVIVSYLTTGAQPGLEYPKQVADLFLLARTDFAQLFKMLPKHEYDYYKINAGHWINLVLKVAGMEGESKENVIKKGIRPDPYAPYRQVGPTREMWLIFMTKGADLLSSQLEDEFESMGEFGARTEKVGSGKHEKDGGIFEFRGFQRKKIPLSEWKPFALTFFDFLLNLQNPGELEKREQSEQLRKKYYGKLGLF